MKEAKEHALTIDKLKVSKIKKSKENTAFPRKLVLIGVSILFQIAFFVLYLLDFLSKYYFVYYIFLGISLLIVLRVVYSKKNSSSKISWIIFILVFMPFGSLTYILWGETTLPYYKRKRMQRMHRESLPYLTSGTEAFQNTGSVRTEGELNLIRSCTGYSPHENAVAAYLSPGEAFFEKLLEALASAQKFIFLEFFIVADGHLLQAVLEILTAKARAGVEVRFLVDDYGCKTRLSSRTRKLMKQSGIRIRRFNRVRPVLDFFMNYRDHKKIAVIDGTCAFTGGVNIADEYANIKERFGYWKDAGIYFEGDTVNDFTVMFLRMWAYTANKSADYQKYLVARTGGTSASAGQGRTKDGGAASGTADAAGQQGLRAQDGAQPSAQEGDTVGRQTGSILCAFEDGPAGKYPASVNLFMKMIAGAQRYIYIQTPYLIIEDNLTAQLIRTAKSGVDVRIYTPGIADKKLINMITRAHYKELIAAGVRIFEYSPGFLHSKVLLSDDECAFVGTINMDYRSFYQQYECGVYVARSPALKQIAEDFDSLTVTSHEVNQDYRPQSVLKRLFLSVAGLFAPLM